MENPLGESKFLCGHTDALSDILTVVEEIQRRLNVSTVNLCGLSWGGLLSSKFTNLYPQLVENLILLGPVYAVQNPAWSLFMDPKNPNTLHPGIGGYRYLGEDSLFLMWDSEIPHGDKSLWQDPLVKEAIITELLQADEEWSSKHNMRSFRSPTGVIKDIEEVYNKRPLFDPKLIECPTLIVRGDYDKASLKEDTDELFKQLGAQRKYYITLGNMTHYALAERRCGEVMACVRNFLSDEGMRWK
jgi:pimeloyl-ACP methyl ester carboxylesterase